MVIDVTDMFRNKRQRLPAKLQVTKTIQVDKDKYI